MSFPTAVWAAGFPESEDGVLSLTLTTADYVKITGLPTRKAGSDPRPLMIEMHVRKDVMIYRGPASPLDGAPSMGMGSGERVRFELSPSDSLYVARVTSTNTFISLRVWTRE